MYSVSRDYQTLVLDDLKSYAGLNHPVKASLFERLRIRELPVDELHPNPEDEFCDPKIGPSDKVLSRYLDDWNAGRCESRKPELERICVEKMSVGGYMILDGHHRWMEAWKCGLFRVPVQIMNVTPVSEVLSSVAASSRKICASFDLDEVLLRDAQPLYAGSSVPTPLLGFLKTSMRKNAPALIRELQAMGIDVWVYTGSFMEEEKLKHLFGKHHVQPDGLVNGLKNGKRREAIRKAFVEKYMASLHIDRSGIVCVDTRTKAYEMIELTEDENCWASGAIAAVRQIPLIQELLKRSEN